MTKEDHDAIYILGELIKSMNEPSDGCWDFDLYGRNCLRGAIGHLAYPDRDVYPKTRRGTKGAPIVRK